MTLVDVALAAAAEMDSQLMGTMESRLAVFVHVRILS